MITSKEKMIKAEEFDRAFEKGDVTKYLDRKKTRVHHPIQRINIDIPQEILRKVDEEAERIGVPRTSIIKMWIAERLERLSA